MKKSIINIAFTRALSALLCGCGADRTVDGTVGDAAVSASPMPTVTVTPMVTPNVDNGIVGDKDGVIDDTDGAAASPAVTDDAAKLPSPNVSTMPSASAKQ